MSHRTTARMNLLNHEGYEGGQTDLIEQPPTNYSRFTEPSDISSSLEIYHQDLAGKLTPFTPGGFLDSIFSLAWPIDQPGRTSPQLTQPSQIDDIVDQSDDLEDMQSALTGFLALDQTVESNGLPFVLQECAAWLTLTYVTGEKPRQILHLVANTVNGLTPSSAEYDPAESTCFPATEAIFRQRLAEAGTRIESSRGLNQQQANEAMIFVNQWILTKYRVDSLSSVLGFMQLVVPIFRRAFQIP
ncbi:hypothetical protein RSOLAG22IIIB_07052 [Rhizoctonia solani]|uniref:Uncharacterized protein n=1 Tax=Rhizoctonia solani TaxID=456999 RepID=A0A0K6GIX0_9AGAM|nr:hypothetical protein RSOLAG22IIIB_07052 [Rhizoctonia solani]